MAWLDDVLAGLACGRQGCGCGRMHGGSVYTHCPAHEDGHTSLSATEKGGRPLVRCHAGCSQAAVVDALKVRDLWPKPQKETQKNEAPRGRVTKQVIATYDYRAEDGSLLFQVQRMKPKSFLQRRPDPDAPGGFAYDLQGVRRVPYRLPGLLAHECGPVFICEGEKDADLLASEGLTATTNAGGAGKWPDDFARFVENRAVVILPDNDVPGRDHAEKVAASVHAAAKSVRILHLDDLPEKGDVSLWFERGGTAPELIASAKRVPPFVPAPSPPPSLPDDGKGGPSELALATAWAAGVKDSILYVEGDQWWQYHGGLWSYSSLELVQANVQRFLTAMRAGNEKVGVTRARVQNVVFLGKSLLGPVPLTEFDTHPEWIPLRNGVFDTRTGTLIPHSPQNRLTRQAPYEYDPAARSPRWEKFLLEVMLTPEGFANSEWIGILQEWFGYCLISDTTAQTAMFWVGEGQNGKGTATRVLEQLVGADACTAIPIEQLHDPYYRAALYGKMVGLVNEPEPKAIQKNGTFFKALTGGDRIDARRPTEKVFSFFPTCRLIISCNDLPSTRDVSRGYFRRIILIEWRYNVPNAVREGRLDDVLRGELPGIFNWAMRGLSRWNARGRAFDVPQESSDLLSDYRMSEDTVGRFVEEETAPDDAGFVSNAAIYGAYAKWCRESGERAESAAMMGRRLKKMGLRSSVRRIGNASVRGWGGRILNESGDP